MISIVLSIVFMVAGYLLVRKWENQSNVEQSSQLDEHEQRISE